jgi:hypothetical protein
MLAAARREKVEDRVAIAEAAGLTATVMDIESYAARAALQRCSTTTGPAGQDRRPVPDRRPGHPRLRAAERRDRLRARAALRRRPADPGNRARLRPVLRGRGSAQEGGRPAGQLSAPTCWRPSWTTPRWKSRARSSSSSPRRRTPASTRSPRRRQRPAARPGRHHRRPHAHRDSAWRRSPACSWAPTVREQQLRTERRPTWSPAAWHCGGLADDPD